MWGLLDNRAKPTRRGLSYRGITTQAPFSPLGTPLPVRANFMKRTGLIILLIFILLSFSFENDKKQLFLIKDFHNYHLELNPEMKIRDLKILLDSLCCSNYYGSFKELENIKYPYIIINTYNCKQTKNVSNNSLRLGFYFYPCSTVDYDYLYRNVLRISIDTNKITIREKYSYDSLYFYLNKHILNYDKDKDFSENPSRALIEFYASDSLNVNDLMNVVCDVTNEFIKVINFYCKNEFGKRLEEIEFEELDSLKNILNINLWINSARYRVPPPFPFIPSDSLLNSNQIIEDEN